MFQDENNLNLDELEQAFKNKRIPYILSCGSKIIEKINELQAREEQRKKREKERGELLKDAQIISLSEALKRAKAKIKMLTDHKDILIKQAADQQEKLLEYQKFEKSQTTKISQLKELLTAVNQDLIKQQVKHRQAKQKLNKKLERVRIRLAKLQADKKSLKSEHDQDQRIIAKLRLKINNYQQTIQDKDREIDYLDDQLLDLQTEQNHAQQTIAKKRAYVNKQQWQIQQLKDEINGHVCVCPNICCAGDYAKVKQERDNYQQQLDNHTCPSVNNSELESLRTEAKEKDQKIEQLEQEIKALKDKPPVVDNSEVERLLTVVAEKEKVIKELEVKLQAKESQIIKVESEEVKELRQALVKQEKRITRLHVIYLLILSTVALVGLVKLVGGKSRIKKSR